MRGGVGEGGLRRRAVGDAPPREVVCELARVAGVDAEAAGALGVSALGAPQHAPASDVVAVVVDRRSAAEAGALHDAEVGGVVAELAEPAGVDADPGVDIAVALRIRGADGDAPLAVVVCEARGAEGDALVDAVVERSVVGRPGAGGTFLHTGRSCVADVGLRTEGVLAVLSAQPTVVVSVSREIDARPHAGPRVVLAVRVDLHRAERSAERGGRIAPVAVVAHGDAGLVDLAAEVPARASVGADVQNRVSVDIFVLRAVLHAHSSGVVGIRSGRTVERAQLGGVVAPIAVAAVLLALASPRIAVLDVRRGVGAGGHAEPAVGVSVVSRRGAGEHTHVAFSVVVGQGRADRDALVGGVIGKGEVGAGALRHALEGVVEGEGALALEQALSGGVVGVVVRSGRVRTGSGAGSGERL